MNSKDIGWNAAGSQGCVAAGHPDSVAAGLAILRDGGNAADAAVATILALSITDYGLFAIGGEVPFMFYDTRLKQVKVLSGQGRAPLSAEAMQWYETNGIPYPGGIKTAPVPAAVDLCLTALRLYGTLSFAAVVAPALALLVQGKESWHKNLHPTFIKLIDTESSTIGSRERQLLATGDRFYRGDLAVELERFYITNGSFLRKADLAAHTTPVEEPISIRFGDYTVYKCGPWTQGPVMCQALRLVEGYDLHDMGHLSADYIHVVAEALKLALADRDRYYADPNFVDVPMQRLLSDDYTTQRRGLIDLKHVATNIEPGETWIGGTTTCVVSDRWGNVVSATPSANRPYAICDELGVAHGTRLTSLNTTPGHPNHIAPGKRPRITLTPTLAVRDDGSVLGISVAGGDLQDQTSLNCFLNHAVFGMKPEQALTAPRFSMGHHQDSFRPDADREKTVVEPLSLTIHSKIGEDVSRELASRGHRIQRTDGAIACPVMIHLDARTGVAHAAGDPAAGRHAGSIL